MQVVRFETALITLKSETEMQATLYRIAAALFVAVGCVTSVSAAPDQQLLTESKHAAQSDGQRIHAAGQCHFRIDNMYGGFYEDPEPGDSPPQGFYHMPDSGPARSPVLNGGFGLFCVDAGNAERIASFIGTKQLDGQWLQMNEDEAWVPFDRDQQFEIIDFHGANWVGRGTLMNDTTGDESTRTRWFQFCLVHERLALCGKAPVSLLSNKKIDELPKIKSILQSIKFIDE